MGKGWALGVSENYSYMDHASDAASFAAFNRHEETNQLISAESTPENISLIDFEAFAKEYPEKLFPLLARLRPEFQELFLEYYVLHKSQSFLAKTHGFIQTRTWQNLRIIEQAVGSLIVLGPDPDFLRVHEILRAEGLDVCEYGPLAGLITNYAKNQSYAAVAKAFGAPTPAIRKIFRPAIDTLLASKNIKSAALGAYLRSLTHQASLTGGGLSKSCIARIKRVKKLKFAAPAAEDFRPLISLGQVSALHDTPWNMFEISSDHRMAQIFPVLRAQCRRIFGKKPAQIFAPLDGDGELQFGYILARSASKSLTRSLTRVRGISEMSATYDGEGNMQHTITVPDGDVQKLIGIIAAQEIPDINIGDFVQIATGEAAKYHGTVIGVKKSGMITVGVMFPTGRQFIVTADSSAVNLPPRIPLAKRAFWGEKL